MALGRLVGAARSPRDATLSTEFCGGLPDHRTDNARQEDAAAMTKVFKGDKVVAYAGTLLLKEDEPVRLVITFPLNAPISTEALTLEFLFKNPTRERTGVSCESGSDKVVRFFFSGFQNPAGTALAEPISFGQVNNQPLSLNLAHYWINGFNIAHVEVLLGGQDTAGSNS
jgi:hypothetical protein